MPSLRGFRLLHSQRTNRNMSSSRVVTILGATGHQGASAVHRILKDGTFTPRAITRDPTSPAASDLKKLGVEVVQGDMKDKASLVKALRGSEALVAVTFAVFPPYSAENPSEETIGKIIIDAAVEAGVKFIVFSSCPNLERLSGGKYKNIFLYDDKVKIEEYMKASGIPNASLHLGSFVENLWTQHALKQTDDGFTLTVPKHTQTSRQSLTWIGHDFGEAALAVLKNYDDPLKDVSGKVFPVVTASITYPDFVAKISKALGKEVTFVSIPTTGNEAFDGMYAAQTEYDGFYTSTPVPNPELVALGAKFATIEECIETEIKKRYV
ncbi:NmrA domain-containing protein [Favolaschia claudopus]|uniref:NmrA domain-containing protein n=1 Tax=Favolaschia claudopus TaxID=2862362 RepID=A0AAW0DYS4_9AGAR